MNPLDEIEHSEKTSGNTDEIPLVALAGPPNSGKTTLFNRLTGLRQKVANYPGVTVEKHIGEVRSGGQVLADLVDLPGIHGFSARTLDEKITKEVLEGQVDGVKKPDAVIMVTDSTRLENQLMLVEQVLELNLPTLLVLNMSDELKDRGGSVNATALAERLGVQVVWTNGRTGEGTEEITEYISQLKRGNSTQSKVSDVLKDSSQSRTLPVLERFSKRKKAVKEVVSQVDFVPPKPSAISGHLDSLVLHKIWGPMIFFAVVILVFQSIFTWAVPLMDGIQFLIEVSGSWISGVLADTWFRSLLIDGIWAGVGSVVVFLPQILILFLFIGILEDSGYMARAAVIADRVMYRIGLQGRAFLPLLSGYACAVPAILSARTIEDDRDRLATIFVTPFMTCSARLPVYVLLIAAFIPNEAFLGSFLSQRTVALILLYALGIIAAVITAFILKRTLLKAESSTFLMELPPYRLPSLQTLGLRLLDRGRIFLTRVGKIIFTVTIILWFLTQFPRTEFGAPQDIEQSALGQIGHVIEPVIAPLGFDWRIGIGLVTSLAAREVIVGTLGTIYGIETADEESLDLQSALQESLSFPAAMGLLVFFAFALQCMSTVATVKRETGGWKWASFQFLYMLALGYFGAFLAFRLF
ncbi:MAG: ferrous iron transport protein B [Longimicrobiales bacterium]|nr:ferrous iron transport protein B [Longimicrobiales bacterium]